MMKILEVVVSYVTDEGVRVHGASHEEFVCGVVDKLADWDYPKVSVKVWYRSAPGKVPHNAEEFWLIDLQVTIIG
jgi:hypothetical protein